MGRNREHPVRRQPVSWCFAWERAQRAGRRYSVFDRRGNSVSVAEPNKERTLPIYEYRCEVCGARFEKLTLTIGQEPPDLGCPTCGSGDLQRLISPVAVHGGDPGSLPEEESPPPKPPVFGRKELNEVLKNKKP
jgi:putative FmdB family regulatory protein